MEEKKLSLAKEAAVQKHEQRHSYLKFFVVKSDFALKYNLYKKDYNKNIAKSDYRLSLDAKRPSYLDLRKQSKCEFWKKKRENFYRILFL